MRKFFLIAFLCLFTKTWAETVKIDGITYSLDTSTKTAKVSTCDYGFQGAIVIQASVVNSGTTYTVTTIRDYAFSGRTGLTEINIPNTVTSIGDHAFRGCTGLAEINIPNSVTSIENGVFEDCTGLAEITIPNSVTSIGDYAFGGCVGLTEINIPNSVTSIGDYAFDGCTGLAEINIPNSVTSIGGSAFSGCTGLESINVADENTKYSSLDGILYNKDKSCLLCCPEGKQISSFVIPNSVTSIGYCAFVGCTGLTEINIPNSVTSIGGGAFAYTGLTEINLPNSVTSIGDYAFEGCVGLTEINLPNSVTNIGDYVFRSCTGLTNITIPNSVKSIDRSWFDDCANLKNITIPSSVTSIDSGAFDDCKGLETINVSDENTEYSSLDGILYNKDKSSLLRCPKGKQISSFVIPNSVTSIGYCAFSGCVGLTEINLPNSVTSIGGSAFSGCVGLTEINLPNSVTSIGGGAFAYTGLAEINIPNSVTSIGDYAFEGCVGLTEINIPNSVTSIGDYAFGGCKGLEAINVSDDNTQYSSLDGILYNKDKSSLLRCPEGKQISSFVIPNSVTSIGSGAFSGCNNLQDLYILSSTVSLGRSLGTCNTVYAYKKVLNLLDDKGLNYKRKIEICNSYYMLSDIQHLNPSTITFLVKELPSKGSIGTLVRVECDGKVLSPNASGIYTLADLILEKNYTISLVVDVNGTEETYQQIINNPKPQFELSVKADQTRMELSVNSEIIYTDIKVKEIGVKCDGKDYSAVSTINYYGKITISNLVPDKNYYVRPYIIFEDDTRIEGSSTFYSTKGVSPKIKGSFNGPTAYKAHGSYYLGTATLKDATLYFDGKKYEGNDIYITGLNPDTKYTVEYVVTTNEGSTETDRQTITTPALELTTLQPKGVSERCSIVAATTNICDDEPNVGFQWKKYDAPESLKPSEGYAAIYDGQLEGYIKNLQPTSYYKVRAFYKSATDKYYYGDWVTFDPSDFSYFEPTVHTYEATDVTSTSAKVKGYVLAGTDNIIEQGFEYWPVNISQSKAMRVVAAENNVSTIFCTGQVMTATLTDLLPNTTYRFRSFVKTASGMTYGEEQMLTTAYDPTGIGGVDTSSSEITVIGYYDINGRKLDGIGNGITIVRYSNGSVRKVVRK